jgi:hypothetical protein
MPQISSPSPTSAAMMPAMSSPMPNRPSTGALTPIRASSATGEDPSAFMMTAS